jgi:hypothetical protein
MQLRHERRGEHSATASIWKSRGFCAQIWLVITCPTPRCAAGSAHSMIVIGESQHI